MCQRETVACGVSGRDWCDSVAAGLLQRRWDFMVRGLFQTLVQQFPEQSELNKANVTIGQHFTVGSGGLPPDNPIAVPVVAGRGWLSLSLLLPDMALV